MPLPFSDGTVLFLECCLEVHEASAHAAVEARPCEVLAGVAAIARHTSACGEAALALCQKCWAEYRGPRSFAVDTITFVRNTGNCGWSDLQDVALERQPVPALY